ICLLTRYGRFVADHQGANVALRDRLRQVLYGSPASEHQFATKAIVGDTGRDLDGGGSVRCGADCLRLKAFVCAVGRVHGAVMPPAPLRFYSLYIEKIAGAQHLAFPVGYALEFAILRLVIHFIFLKALESDDFPEQPT